jgi:ribosomal protein L17
MLMSLRFDRPVTRSAQPRARSTHHTMQNGSDSASDHDVRSCSWTERYARTAMTATIASAATNASTRRTGYTRMTKSRSRASRCRPTDGV